MLHRLLYASYGYGYGYDAIGNRLAKTVGANTDTYAYSATSNQLATLARASGPARSFTFDANGSTTNDGVNRKLPRNVDSLEVELSGTMIREGGSNEELTVYGAADCLVSAAARAVPGRARARDLVALNEP